MKEIKAQAKSSMMSKANRITGGQYKAGHSARGYANGGGPENSGGPSKGSKTQINIIVGREGPGAGAGAGMPARPPMPLPMPMPGPMPGGQPPLGGVAGPMRKRGGRA